MLWTLFCTFESKDVHDFKALFLGLFDVVLHSLLDQPLLVLVHMLKGVSQKITTWLQFIKKHFKNNQK
jgi:hypothetical protein